MSMFRVRTVLAGFTGGPGLMTQYFAPAAAGFNEATAQLAVDRVDNALTAGALLFPTNLTWSIDGAVDVLDEATGDLTDSVQVTGASGAGTMAGGGWAPAPVGLAVTWLTTEFKAGRRVRGRTFLVPVHEESFDFTGTPSTGGLNAANAFATAMGDAGATDLVHVVWSRPVNGAGGSKHGITGYKISDKAAVLRSRRD